MKKEQNALSRPPPADVKRFNGTKMSDREGAFEYRVGDAYVGWANTRSMVQSKFPGSIMAEYLASYGGDACGFNDDAEERLTVLSRVLDERCGNDARSGNACLVALRTGDVIRPGHWGHDIKLPMSPAAVAHAVAGCSETLFITGKHGGGAAAVKATTAYLSDLEEHMGDQPHAVVVAGNTTAQEVDDDLCLATGWAGRFWPSGGHFHSLIGEVRRHRNLPTSLDLQGGNTHCCARTYRYAAHGECEPGDTRRGKTVAKPGDCEPGGASRGKTMAKR